MKVFFKDKVFTFDEELKVKELLDRLSINENEYIFIDKKRKKLLTPDNTLKSDDEIEIRRVISGG